MRNLEGASRCFMTRLIPHLFPPSRGYGLCSQAWAIFLQDGLYPTQGSTPIVLRTTSEVRCASYSDRYDLFAKSSKSRLPHELECPLSVRRPVSSQSWSALYSLPSSLSARRHHEGPPMLMGCRTIPCPATYCT